MHDTDYINDYGVARGLSWAEFSESIKHTNRFFSSNFNSDVFSSFLTMVQKTYEKVLTFIELEYHRIQKVLLRKRCSHRR